VGIKKSNNTKSNGYFMDTLFGAKVCLANYPMVTSVLSYGKQSISNRDDVASLKHKTSSGTGT